MKPNQSPNPIRTGRGRLPLRQVFAAPVSTLVDHSVRQDHVAILISAGALVVSALSLVHTVRKGRREEKRAQRADARLLEVERKQREEEERRARSDAPYFVPMRLFYGTSDAIGRPLVRLAVKNEGRDCVQVTIEETPFRLSKSSVRNGEDVQIEYPTGMYEKGYKLKITFRFESSSGYRSSHRYEIGSDDVYLRRIEPA